MATNAELAKKLKALEKRVTELELDGEPPVEAGTVDAKCREVLKRHLALQHGTVPEFYADL